MSSSTPVTSRRSRGFHAFGFRRRWPVLVWILALVVFFFLLDRLGGGITLSGVVMKERITLSAPMDGRIKELRVQTGAAVSANMSVLSFDDAPIHAGIETERSQIALEQLRARRDRMQADAGRIRLQQERDRIRLETQAELSLIRQRAASAKAQLSQVNAELDRLQPLVDQHLADATLLADHRMLRDRLTAEISGFPDILSSQEAILVWATSPIARPEDSEEVVAVDADPLALLRQQLELCELRSSTAGTVGQVFVNAGQTVTLGTPLVELITPRSNQVLAFLPEERARSLHPGAEFLVQGSRNLDVTAHAVVRDVLPDVVGLNQDGLLIPQRVVRGRYVLLEIEGDTPFLPGESVVLRHGDSSLSTVRGRLRRWFR